MPTTYLAMIAAVFATNLRIIANGIRKVVKSQARLRQEAGSRTSKKQAARQQLLGDATLDADQRQRTAKRPGSKLRSGPSLYFVNSGPHIS